MIAQQSILFTSPEPLTIFTFSVISAKEEDGGVHTVNYRSSVRCTHLLCLGKTLYCGLPKEELKQLERIFPRRERWRRCIQLLSISRSIIEELKEYLFFLEEYEALYSQEITHEVLRRLLPINPNKSPLPIRALIRSILNPRTQARSGVLLRRAFEKIPSKDEISHIFQQERSYIQSLMRAHGCVK